MQLQGDYDYYCQQLGRSPDPSNWNRLVKALGLAGMGVVDRRIRLNALAEIRKIKPKAAADPVVIEAYLMLRSLEMAADKGGELQGAKIVEMVQTIRPVKLRCIQGWGYAHGLKMAPTRIYRGEDLRQWLWVIARHVPAVREVREKFIEV